MTWHTYTENDLGFVCLLPLNFLALEVFVFKANTSWMASINLRVREAARK